MAESDKEKSKKEVKDAEAAEENVQPQEAVSTPEKKSKKAKKEPEAPVFETIERPQEEVDEAKEKPSETLGLLMDVELDLSVLLGSTYLPLSKILDLTKGSIIELDSTTSKPIDLLANGKVIAKGEVVIIEDNFGLRITNMVEENVKII